MPPIAILQQYSFDNKTVEIFVPGDGTREPHKLSPYWAKVWPAAIGLCQFLATNSRYVKNKKVLELAAGLGLPGIFSAIYAKQVTISDIEPAAVQLIGQSIAHNQFSNVYFSIIDWNDFRELTIPDVLLLSDINYEPAQFNILATMIRYFLSNQVVVILSTPQRLMAKTFISQLSEQIKQQTEIMIDQQGHTTAVSIFVLNGY